MHWGGGWKESKEWSAVVEVAAGQARLKNYLTIRTGKSITARQKNSHNDCAF